LSQQAQATPGSALNQWAGLHPDHAANHVLQDNAGCHDQAAHKTAAGQVVAAQQEVQGNQRGDRQQQAQQDGWNLHDAFGQRGLGIGFHKDGFTAVLDVLATGQRLGDGFNGWTESTQQGEDRQGNNTQHHNFTKGIKTAEVHQNHVYHVGAAAQRQGLLDKKGRDAAGARARHHGVGQCSDTATGQNGNNQVAATAEQGASTIILAARHITDALRQPAQAQQNQHDGDYFHRQLGKRQIRGGQPGEGQAGNQSSATRQ